MNAPDRLDDWTGANQRLLVADPKAGDRRVVGDLVGADHPKGDVLATAALDRAR